MKLEIDVPNKLIVGNVNKNEDWSELIGGWGIFTKALTMFPKDYQIILYDGERNYTTTVGRYSEGQVVKKRTFLSIYKFDEQ